MLVVLTFNFLLVFTFASFAKAPYPEDEKKYILRPEDGFGDRKFLSTNAGGDDVFLWFSENGSGRQVWKFKKIGVDIYNLIITNGLNDGVTDTYLSVHESGNYLGRLESSDNGDGLVQWKFNYRGENGNYPVFNIENVKHKRWFSVCPDLVWTGLWDTIDDTGLQNWVLIPYVSTPNPNPWIPEEQEYRNSFEIRIYDETISWCHDYDCPYMSFHFYASEKYKNIKSSDFTLLNYFLDVCLKHNLDCKVEKETTKLISINGITKINEAANSDPCCEFSQSNHWDIPLNQITISDGEIVVIDHSFNYYPNYY